MWSGPNVSLNMSLFSRLSWKQETELKFNEHVQMYMLNKW